jgi:hypothetical protein
MLPEINTLTEEIIEVEYPTNTYHIKHIEGGDDRIVGYTDDLEAVKQAIYLILNIERYDYPIYSWDYGIELKDLFGKPIPYVISELPDRIKDALTMDNRITDVVDFEFERNKNKLHTTFTVITIYGNVPSNVEVTI